jgi:hypothetical protein
MQIPGWQKCQPVTFITPGHAAVAVRLTANRRAIKETLIPFPEVIPVSSFIPSLFLGVDIVDKNSSPKRCPSLAKKVPNRK